MKINWLELWDKLSDEIKKKNSWGKNEVVELMDSLEKKAVRSLEERRHEEA